MKRIKQISVNSVFAFDNHNVNSDKQMNPKTNGQNSIISGEKLAYCRLKTIESILSKEMLDKYVVGAGEHKSEFITKDLSSLFRGYMLTETGKRSNVKMACLGYPVAESTSVYKEYISENTRFSLTDTNHMPFNRVLSKSDVFEVSEFLDTTEFASYRYHTFNNQFLVNVKNYKVFKNEEIKRILLSYVESLRFLDGLAQQASSSVKNTPNAIFIAFDTYKRSSKFFSLSEKQQDNYLKDITNDGGKYFIGNDGTDYSVSDALRDASEYLNTCILECEDYDFISEEELKMKFDEHFQKIIEENKAIAALKKLKEKEKENKNKTDDSVEETSEEKIENSVEPKSKKGKK